MEIELSHREKWWARMIEKHGSEEAVKEFMAAKAREVKNRKGGYFRQIAGSEELRQLSKKAADKRWKS